MSGGFSRSGGLQAGIDYVTVREGGGGGEGEEGREGRRKKEINGGTEGWRGGGREGLRKEESK